MDFVSIIMAVLALCKSRRNISFLWKSYNTHLTRNICFAAIELIKLLMNYEVQDTLLRGLVRLLRPSKEDIRRPDIMDGMYVR